MNKRTNPKDETAGQPGAIESQRPTSLGWEELADRIEAGHRITVTLTRNGTVIETFEFNEPGAKPETQKPEAPRPVAADDQEPRAEPKTFGWRVAAQVATAAQTVWAFVRSLSLGNVITFLLCASFAIVFVVVWLLPTLAIIVPFLLVMTVIVYAYHIAFDALPDFPGKELFVMLLLMLILANAYAYLMRGA